MTRKSKYNLQPYALVKIPKEMYQRLIDLAGDDWSEKARDIIQATLMKEEA